MNMQTKPESRNEFAAGWPVLLAATLGIGVATTAIPFYSMGVFIKPLEAARGWSRSEISLAASLFSFSLPITILLLGQLIDRFGVRRVAVTGHVMLGLSYLALSATGSDVRVFWAIYIFAAITAIGASPITYTRALIQYFDCNRGLAIGVSMSGAGVSAAVAPPALEWVIRTHGVAAAYQALAAALFIIAGLAFLLLPAARGGRVSAEADDEAVAADETHRSATGRNQQRGLLAAICIGVFIVALSVNGYIIHLAPLLEGRGLTSAQAADVAIYLGLAVVIGRLATGYLLDRVPTAFIGAGVFSMAACGVLLLQIAGPSAAPFAVMLLGFTVGAEVDIVAYLISTLFGKASFSRFFSFAYAAFMLGSGVSPLLAARIFDLQGDYTMFFNLSVGLLLLVSAGFLALYGQQKRAAAL